MISAHLITHQCVILDYCVESTIRCMMGLCDDIYINDGSSTDGTLDILYSLQNEYGKGRIKLFVKDWQHNRQMWANEKNFLLDKMPIDAYILAIDADEVLNENDFDQIRKAVSMEIPAIAFNVIHFYGVPTHYIEGPAWYKQHTRLWRHSTGIRLLHRNNGCADDLVWADGFPAHSGRNINCGASIYHYGNCRDPKALGMKAKKADDLYQYSNVYEGGKIASPRSFTYAFDSVGAKIFSGAHPKYIADWYNRHVNQDTYFNAQDGETNKLWCF